MKKRKKAETLRILDMEKRQKQRVEEMRENQKKVNLFSSVCFSLHADIIFVILLFKTFNLLLQNEETLSLKEALRSEVRKDLESMEKKHIDMASILRGLGIPVGGGLFPMPNQVCCFV